MISTNYYQIQINKAVRHINLHLNEEVRILDLAQEANFSAFHFQRLYQALQGESPYQTLLRLRLEKSVALLRNETHLKISEVAFDCGFSAVENFSRQFKARFKCTPSAFRKDKKLQNSRIYQEDHPQDFYTRIEKSRGMPQKDREVTVEELPALQIAYIRGIFGTDGSVLVKNYLDLIAWAEKQKIPYLGPQRRFGMSIDNPEVTPAEKYRYDFALRLDKSVLPEGLIEFGEIPGGLYATVHCEGKLEEVAQCWDHLYKEWLPSHAYIPRHYPALEEFIQGPEAIGWENFNLNCRIPVRPLDDSLSK